MILWTVSVGKWDAKWNPALNIVWSTISGELELEPAHTKYTADTDSLVLEDETMRVKMEDTLGKMKPGDLVNGVVAGVWGREAKGGRFAVKEVFFSGLEKDEEAKNEDLSKIGAKSLCLMSGLQLGGEGGESLSAAQLAIDWLVGSAAGPEEQSAVAEVGRLVIAGDSLSDLTREKGEQNKALYLTVGSAAGSIAAVRQLDDLLVQAALTVAVDLMPGPQVRPQIKSVLLIFERIILTRIPPPFFWYCFWYLITWTWPGSRHLCAATAAVT